MGRAALPGVLGGFRHVARTVRVHERVTRARIALELVGLSEAAELTVELGDVVRTGVRIVLAKQAEHRARDTRFLVRIVFCLFAPVFH